MTLKIINNNMKKNTILIISDDPRYTSGVGNQCRHICKKLDKNGYDVLVLGVITSQSPKTIVNHTWDTGEKCRIINHDKFDDMSVVMKLIDSENPSCMVLFTDPHRFYNIFASASFIREKLPIYFVHVWDTYLVAQKKDGRFHYNLPLYESVDGIGCISKQTEWFVNETFKKSIYAEKRPLVHYVGHGSDPLVYRPLTPFESQDLKKALFKGRDFEFIVSMINRNQGRKKFPDLMEAWSLFMDSLSSEEKNKCALLLHTEPVSPHGTNLFEVGAAIAPECNIYYSTDRYNEDGLNQLLNISDVVVNISNAEGFGLCGHEAMLAGRATIQNATGGLVDQIGFFDNGIPISWTPENKKRLKEFSYGLWSKPVFPNRTIIGTPVTPYLYDENANIDDVAEAIRYWYDMGKNERNRRGLLGRDWCENRGLTNRNFASNVLQGIEQTLENFKPVNLFNMHLS